MLFYRLYLIILLSKHLASLYLLALASGVLFSFYFTMSLFSLEPSYLRPAVSFREAACPLRGSALASASCPGPLPDLPFLGLTTPGNENSGCWAPRWLAKPQGRVVPSSGNGSVHSLLRWPQASFLVLSHPYSKGAAFGVLLQALVSPCPLSPVQPREKGDVCHQDRLTASEWKLFQLSLISQVATSSSLYTSANSLVFHPSLAIHIKSFRIFYLNF